MEKLLGYLAQGLDDLSPEQAYKRICSTIEEATPIERDTINDFLYDVSGFFMDTESDNLNKLMASSQDTINQTPARDALFAQNSSRMTGLVIKRSEVEIGAVFLPDASEPGRFRFSEFDSRGFFAHQTFDDYKEAFFAAWSQGYRELSSVSWFESLSQTDNWSQGMDLVNKIALWNRGDKKAFDEPPSLKENVLNSERRPLNRMK